MPSSCRTVALVVAAFTVLLACHHGDPPVAVVDVYVAGWQWEGDNQVGRQIATVWKNGVPQALSDSPSIASAVAVSGDDVIVAGCVLDRDLSYYEVATVWRNGVRQTLTDGSYPACAVDVAVSGADVYVAGNEGVPKLWKNGVGQALPHDVVSGSGANALAVAEGEVYVAGWVVESTEVSPGALYTAPAATLWMNGAPVSLTKGRASVANAVVVDGQDVYVAGKVAVPCEAPCSSPYIATVWKNGVPLALTDGIHGAVPTSVAVHHGVVYVAGMQSNGTTNVPTVWIDGAPVRLWDGSEAGIGMELAVAGQHDVHVAGNIGSFALYWRNGVPVWLSSPRTGEALAIAVVER